MEWLKNIHETIENIPVLKGFLEFIFITILVFGGAYIILRIARKSIELSQRQFGVAGKKRAETLFKLVKSISKYVTIPLYIILILPIFGINPTAVFAGAGAIGVIVGFAFQDFLKDIVSGFFIVFEKVYEVEDYVTIDNTYTGTVITISLKATTLESWTGEIYTINNRDVKNVTNYTTANFAISENEIKVAKNVDYEEFKKIYNREIANFIKTHKKILVERPQIKSIDRIENNGYVICFHSKVKALEQYQYRRDFNQFLIDMCRKNNIEVPVEKVEISHE